MGGAFTQGLVVLGILQFMLRADDQTVKVTEELLRQHEEQRSQEMAWLLEMEHRSQESPRGACCSCPASAGGSGPLQSCSSFSGLYWLPRQRSSGYNSSACGEAPAVPSRKRRRRKRMRGIADYGDKLDQIRSPDLRLEWKDMQNSEEDGMKGMIYASAKPFPQETFGQSCIQGIH